MRAIFLASALIVTLSGAGCVTSDERAAGGAVMGAGTGAVVGALATGRPGGALAGAAIGAGTGAIVGAATTPRYLPPPPPPAVYAEEEVDRGPVCRTRVDRISDAYGNIVEVRRSRVCR